MGESIIMIKHVGYDKDGKVLGVQCKEHNYDELPQKGLGKSFANVGLMEPVNIPASVGYNLAIWNHSKVEIERRAVELDAQMYWRELPSTKPSGEHSYQLWFAKKD